MPNPDIAQAKGKKGVIMLLTLSIIMVVAILAAIILNIISVQSRLTHHQVSRIRAYYAGVAGMNLAFENLRIGAWGTGTYYLCNSNAICTAAPYSFPSCNRVDGDVPYCTSIAIEAPNTSIDGVGRRIRITTNYVYTP